MRVLMSCNNFTSRTRYINRGCRCKRGTTDTDRSERLSLYKSPLSSTPSFAICRTEYNAKICNVDFCDTQRKDRAFYPFESLHLNRLVRNGASMLFCRNIHVALVLHDKEPLKPSSKVEKTVQALKEDLKADGEKTVAPCPEPKKSLWRRFVDECIHYYHGLRLLGVNVMVSRKLLWRVIKGHSLTRREHKLLVRTCADMFRMVPFSVFIIVPFTELLLPFYLKFFPGLLPHTFETASDRDAKIKRNLKVKLEMAKFLQETLDDMSVQGKGHATKSTKDFSEFVAKVRSTGDQPTTEQIMKFSKLFEDEITLDSLRRPQLIALCRLLEMSTLGTNNFLRFQLRMKLRSLVADDKIIQKEGIEALNSAELQQACRARGMRSYGVTEIRLKSQLAQWLDLSLNEKVPPSLLLLSRAMLLPETLPASDQLKATISVLPDTVVTQAKAAMGEREGVVDSKMKIEVIKDEVRLIKEEQLELKEEQKRIETETVDKDQLPCPPHPADPRFDAAAAAAVADPTPLKELSSTDLETLEDALDSVGKDRKRLLVEKEELDDLKEELADYQEDVQDLKQVLSTPGGPTLKESKGAKRLYKKVNSMISKMDDVLAQLELEEKELKMGLDAESKSKSEELVSIEELINAIKKLQKVPDESLIERITEVLAKIDCDRDGAIRVDDVLRVIELVGKENVKLSKKQLDEIIELMSKEEIIELEGQIERVLEKQSLDEGQPSKKEGA